MKKSEKIGIAIVVVLAIIVAINLLYKESTKTSRKDICNQLCQPSGPKSWFLIGFPMNAENNFSTKDECMKVCVPEK